MAVADLARSGLLLERLEVLVHSYLEEDEALRFMAFARTFHAGTLEEDLDGRNMEDVYGALMSVRRLCETPSDQAVSIRIFNPSLASDGWVSPHSVAQIRHPDSPFIVDSFLMALARRELTLHSMHNVVLRLTRDTSGCITDLEGSAERAEVVIHAEIDRLDVEEFDAFEADLRETLADVRAAVGDFRAMRARIEALIEGIDGAASAIDADEREEARAFLQWLLDDNFTFLGYREFVIDDEDDRRVVRQVTAATT